jgi:hypothetical protein
LSSDSEVVHKLEIWSPVVAPNLPLDATFAIPVIAKVRYVQYGTEVSNLSITAGHTGYSSLSRATEKINVMDSKQNYFLNLREYR